MSKTVTSYTRRDDPESLYFAYMVYFKCLSVIRSVTTIGQFMAAERFCELARPTLEKWGDEFEGNLNYERILNNKLEKINGFNFNG